MSKSQGILLLSMGGPENLDVVEDYINRLLADPLVVRMPLGRFYQNAFARFIARKRAPRVRDRYRLIGGKSPLLDETLDIARRVETGIDLPVAVAMQYTPPAMKTALSLLKEKNVTDIVVIPLFPQYSTVSSEPVIRTFEQTVEPGLRYTVIRDHHRHPGYIRVLADQIRYAREVLSPEEKTVIVFTAHSIPVKYTAAGDPYISQVEGTVAAVMAALNHDMPHYLAYQSQVGPAKWHAPTLEFTAMKLGHENVKQVVIVPVSFVSENLETLYDLDLDFRKKLEGEGVAAIVRTPAAGNDECYSDVLISIARDAIASDNFKSAAANTKE